MGISHGTGRHVKPIAGSISSFASFPCVESRASDLAPCLTIPNAQRLLPAPPGLGAVILECCTRLRAHRPTSILRPRCKDAGHVVPSWGGQSCGNREEP